MDKTMRLQIQVQAFFGGAIWRPPAPRGYAYAVGQQEVVHLLDLRAPLLTLCQLRGLKANAEARTDSALCAACCRVAFVRQLEAGAVRQ